MTPMINIIKPPGTSGMMLETVMARVMKPCRLLPNLNRWMPSQPNVMALKAIALRDFDLNMARANRRQNKTIGMTRRMLIKMPIKMPTNISWLSVSSTLAGSIISHGT